MTQFAKRQPLIACILAGCMSLCGHAGESVKGSQKRVDLLRWRDCLLVEAQVAQSPERLGGQPLKLRVVRTFGNDHPKPPEEVALPNNDLLPQDRRVQPFLPDPPLREGESGIWLLRERGGTWRVTYDEYFGFDWPVRKGVHESFDRASEFALAVSRTAEAGGYRDRFERLKQYVNHPSSEISAWAVQVLSDHRAIRSEVASFLEELVANERELTLDAQLELDEALLRLSGEPWRGSDLRRKLVRRSVESELSADEAERLIRRLNFLVQQGTRWGFEQPQMLSLIDAAMQNDSLSTAQRCKLIESLLWIPRRHQDDSPGFEFLLSKLDKASAPEVRLSAASTLGHYRLDLTRQNRIYDALEKLQDPQVWRNVERWLDQKKTNERGDQKVPSPPAT